MDSQCAEIEILVFFQKNSSRTGNIRLILYILIEIRWGKNTVSIFLSFFTDVERVERTSKFGEIFSNFEIVFNLMNFYGKL